MNSDNKVINCRFCGEPTKVSETAVKVTCSVCINERLAMLNQIEKEDGKSRD